MLKASAGTPSYLSVDADFLRPRIWATAWSLVLGGRSLKPSTQLLYLRHIDALYTNCDEIFGPDSLDDAISNRDVLRVQAMVEAFHAHLCFGGNITTTTALSWKVVRRFIGSLAKRLASSSESWGALAALLPVMGEIRPKKRGRFKFVRALPDITLRELLKIAEPASELNPYSSEGLQWRNWLIFNLLLLCGLRRGEVLLLATDSLKHDIDADTGEVVYWLDVTNALGEEADSRVSKPSIKTEDSHRQVPVSEGLAELFGRYVEEYRVPSDDHAFLVTTKDGRPLSAESITAIFHSFDKALTPEAKSRFVKKTGGKKYVSPHDLRHTCATARYGGFLGIEKDVALALQRMRAFFGWSIDSEMPLHYSRAAVTDDLMKTWNQLFDKRIEVLRDMP